MHDFGPTALTCTPSYALYLAEAIEKSKYSIDEFRDAYSPSTVRLRRCRCAGEIHRSSISHECSAKDGSHIVEDHFLPEIISPDTLSPLPYGTQGELVFTTITKEGIPLLRYRTKDLCTLTDEPCSCGRTNVRMSRIVGRSDDMLIIRGVNVFPTQVESVILEIEEFEPHYLLIVDRKNNLDTLEIQVEMREEFYSDEIARIQELRRKLAHRVQSVLGLGADIKIVEPQTIERSEGKARRVIDNRKLN